MRYFRKINQSVHIGTPATRLSVFWRDGLAVRLWVHDDIIFDFGF